jgi:pteridine reductase
MSAHATTHTARPHAIITGGARRVGRAIALALAKAGCDVTITYATRESDATETCRLAQELGAAHGVRARAMHAPLGSPDEVERSINTIAASIGHAATGLDILIHNASTYEPSTIATLAGEGGAAAALRDYSVNALAPLLLSARLAPLLRASTLTGGGSIVAMADLHATGRPRKDHASYSMSKAALVEMVQSLARDLAPQVRVNAVAPGVVAWPDAGPESDAKAQAAYLSRVPLARAGTPDDAAEVVRWLAMDAHYVTGEVIRVDGGRWLA